MKPHSSLSSKLYISGLHCSSCEILIEKTLRQNPVVKSVHVSLSRGIINIQYARLPRLTVSRLNRLFKDQGYRFSSKPLSSDHPPQKPDSCPGAKPSSSKSFFPFITAALFILGYLLLTKSNFSSLVSVGSHTALPVFIIFGLLAGFSSCAALVGGIILSLSKQWSSLYKSSDSFFNRAQPHLLFNAGRVIGYSFFGALLATVGGFFRPSPLFSAFLIIAISLIMVLLGLQMLGVKALRHFQLRLPKSITGRIVDESNFSGRLAPTLMGALTFFLPCGFTLTAQALALVSGSPFQGGLIMGLFALGTTPGLLAIGLSSLKFYGNPRLARQFSLTAGILVLFFAIFNINSQLAVLGISTVGDLVTASKDPTAPGPTNLPPMVNGTQVVDITAGASSYSPSRIRLRANTPTRWQIRAVNVSGCTNAIISRGLFNGQINLTNGQTAIKEFTAPGPGIYKFSCWMGMVSGTVEVVDSSGTVGADSTPVESGAGGCGCGSAIGSCAAY